MSALQKKRVLVEQEVLLFPSSSSFTVAGHDIRGLTSAFQVLKALQHPHIVAYIGHFFDGDALHVRQVQVSHCKSVTLAS